jgi:hypothetical protein
VRQTDSGDRVTRLVTDWGSDCVDLGGELFVIDSEACLLDLFELLA